LDVCRESRNAELFLKGAKVGHGGAAINADTGAIIVDLAGVAGCAGQPDHRDRLVAFNGVVVPRKADRQTVGVPGRPAIGNETEPGQICRVGELSPTGGPQNGLLQRQEPFIGHDSGALAGMIKPIPLGFAPILIEKANIRCHRLAMGPLSAAKRDYRK
jgi:hypothetical protein